MKKIPLHEKIIIAMLLGLLWTFISEELGILQFNVHWLAPFGDVFMRLLKFIAVPLVLFSIIKGVSGLSNISELGRMGFKTVLLYLSTTCIAVFIGLFLVNQIGPGKNLDIDLSLNKDNVDKISDIQNQYYESSDESPLQFLVDMVPENIFFSLSDNSSMLQIIFFSLFFAAMLILIPSKKKSYIDNLVDSFYEVFLKMVEVVIRYCPFFIFALLAGTLSKVSKGNEEGIVSIVKGLGLYVLVVLLGLMIMALVVYPLFLKFFTKNFSYKAFFKAIAPAQILAFSTSSSAATLPVTMDCVRDNLKIPNKVSGFVLPIGATVNMDGTSLYQCVAVVFLAQMLGYELSFMTQLLVASTAILASIGSAAVPSAGLFMLVVVLGVAGIDPMWIALVLPVDRILDMCRTVVNVTGDATVCSVVNSFKKKN